MESQIALWKSVANEFATWCSTCATRDGITVSDRVRHEGLSFLTITLPAFGKDFERSLAVGGIDRNLFQGFTWTGGLPRFLSGFLGRVFDRQCGVLLNEPCVESIRAVRQLTLMFSKFEAQCTDERVAKAFRSFVETDKQITDADWHKDVALYWDFVRVSDLLFGGLLSDVGRKVNEGSIVPRHGPGATADRLTGNGKWEQSTWHERLEPCFPSSVMLLPNLGHWESLASIDLLSPDQEPPVRVVAVPKTMKTPRIIAIEPTAMQYCQQAILRCIRDHVSDSRNTLYHLIGLDDQEPNQLLARKGSLTGALATLDLSEASDRVSMQHVLALIMPYRVHYEPGRHEWLDSSDGRDRLAAMDAILACRTGHASVPGEDDLVVLNKYASMGSALTFPLEAMVFLTLIFVSIEQRLGHRLQHSDIVRNVGAVRVFGDDLIVPTDSATTVVSTLEAYGLRVNLHKSFWTGSFRESCGKEYYNGEDVTIVRARAAIPSHRQQVSEVVKTVAFRNHAYKRGFWQTCRFLDAQLEKVLLGRYPVVLETSSVLGRHSFLHRYDVDRVDEYLHSPMVRGYRVLAPIPSDVLDGVGALLKVLCSKEPNGQPFADERHLKRAGRPKAVYIKPGWYSPI